MTVFRVLGFFYRNWILVQERGVKIRERKKDESIAFRELEPVSACCVVKRSFSLH